MKRPTLAQAASDYESETRDICFADDDDLQMYARRIQKAFIAGFTHAQSIWHSPEEKPEGYMPNLETLSHQREKVCLVENNQIRVLWLNAFPPSMKAWCYLSDLLKQLPDWAIGIPPFDKEEAENFTSNEKLSEQDIQQIVKFATSVIYCPECGEELRQNTKDFLLFCPAEGCDWKEHS